MNTLVTPAKAFFVDRTSPLPLLATIPVKPSTKTRPIDMTARVKLIRREVITASCDANFRKSLMLACL